MNDENMNSQNGEDEDIILSELSDEDLVERAGGAASNLRRPPLRAPRTC